MRMSTAWFLSSALVLVGCGSSNSRDSQDADLVGPSPNNCVADPSRSPETAQSLAMGEKATGMICPTGDQDFFTIEVPAGMNLLDVNLAYPASSPSKVALQVRLFEADGVTPVANGAATDVDASDGRHQVNTTLAIPTPGKYVLRVGDASDTATDNVNSYVLQLATAVDPDKHEPNDRVAQAKPADGLPGFFSSVGDVDIYQVTLEPSATILQMTVTNPTSNPKAIIEYEISDSTGKVVGTGKVPPTAVPLDFTQAAPATGTIYVSFHYAADAAPDRKPEVGYTAVLAGKADTDANEKPVRNDTPATATCLAGAGTPCGAVYAAAPVTFPSQTGSIGSRGDRDYFVFRATAAPAVVEATLRIPTTTMNMALDILVPDLASACKSDAECKVLAGSCKENDDCELSHQCVAATAGACATATCRQCVGAGVCLALPDSPGKSVCGVTIFSSADSENAPKPGSDGKIVVRTAQPVFNAGPVYVIAHDIQDDQYDPAAAYTLDVRVVPEPDPMDNSTDPAARNNFYNPKPIQKTELAPNKARAKDITAQIMAGTSVSGYISYQSDEDWFWFNHPCPGTDCGLVFEWVQPGPSPVRPVFFMRTSDLNLHESWTYTGTIPTTAPITDSFGDGDCTECSFAAKKHSAGSATDASAATPYRYYLQIRDAGADDWDFAASGKYEFRLKTINPGCPASCSEMGAGTCGCYCKSKNQCVPGPDL
jgi:hypothetical protein